MKKSFLAGGVVLIGLAVASFAANAPEEHWDASTEHVAPPAPPMPEAPEAPPVGPEAPVAPQEPEAPEAPVSPTAAEPLPGGADAAGDATVLFDKKLDAKPGGQLVLNLDVGSLRIVGVDGSVGRMLVTTAAGADADKMRDRLNLRVDHSDEQVVIEGRTQQGSWWQLGKDRRVQLVYQIWVPRRMSVEMENQTGAVSIRNLIGQVNANTGAGDIELRTVTGEVHLETGAGEVLLSDVNGLTTIESGAGAITIDRTAGQLTAESGAGNIVARAVGGGKIELSTGMGAIDAALNGTNAGVSAQSGMGNVRLTVPRGCGADVSIESGLGSVSLVNWPVKVDHDKDGFTGPLNGGGSNIALHSGAGSVTLAVAP